MSVNKKNARYIQRLKQREGIDSSAEPTKNLYIANAGLGNGIQRENLEQIFSRFGEIVDIIMECDKPHAFVCFISKDCTTAAHNEVNGQVMKYPEDVPVKGVRFHTAYVEEVPGRPPPADCNQIPPGLIIRGDVIDSDYEDRLLNSLQWEDADPDTGAGSSMKHRRVQHFGYEFLYGVNNVNPELPLSRGIPRVCDQFLDGLIERGVLNERPDQLTVNRYEPGQGIPPHVDTHSAFTDVIVSLSLGSDVVMDFRHPYDGRHFTVPLPRRSAMLMTSEARYLWSHGITPRKSDLVTGDSGAPTLQYRGVRTSFTFRRLRRSACNCAYPKECDSQKAKTKGPSDLVLPHNQDDALELERLHVHQVYEDIADHFSDTRHSPWPRVTQFLQSLPDGAVLADIGCGNGKYLGINKGIYAIGNDRSSNLVNVCLERGHEAFVCDVISVPLRHGVCDACICIAVIHHLSTEARRLSAIRELLRLLRPGGLCLIYVWALEQELHKVKSNYLKQSKQDENSGEQSTKPEKPSKEETATDDEKLLPVHVNRTKFVKQDVLVPWTKKGKNLGSETVPEVFHRFYHVFSEGELENLCLQVENVAIERSYYDKGNWCVVLKKL